MTQQNKSPRLAAPVLLAVLLAAAFGSLPAQALYKVVGPDGKITYTDRPTPSSDGKVQTVNKRGGVADDVAMPTELRQAAQRFPVTLYTTTECGPCDSGRMLLRQRGIPYTEKSVTRPEETEALKRITGSLELPALTIGGQILHGLESTEWNTYLDSASYPKESRLPPNFPQGSASPLIEKKESVQAPATTGTTRRQTPAAPEVPASGGFRF
jgi:glutaredoxin